MNFQRISVDSQGRAYLIFGTLDPDYPGITLMRRDPEGWSEPIDIFPNEWGCSGVDIVVDGDDNVNVFLSPWFGIPENGFRRGYNGSWSPIYLISEGRVVDGSGGTMYFQFCADDSESGAISTVWQQGTSHIYARRMLE